MSDIIHLLPDTIANQIAAGEVIQRPASVVKELIENAIDAGASEVQLIIKDAGRTLIQVIDNGKGMSETDARMAFERHATSKIKAAEDLFSLHTLGFRGEALPSIASVAQVELRSKRAEDEVGTLLRISASKMESQEAVACPTGSNFAIRNIFFNVPARRKFLKGNETEKRNILTELERVALVNPSVEFTFIDNDVESLRLPSGNFRQRIIHIFGSGLNQQLIPIDIDTTLIKIRGFIGKPESAKKTRALQYFFVNERYMRHPYFAKAVSNAYEQLILPGENPNFFIYLEVDPDAIDVNIHPTKTEIKFENEQAIWQIIYAVVKESLGKSNEVPTIDFDTKDAVDIPIYDPSKETAQPQVRVNPTYNPFNASSANNSSYQTSKPNFDWEKLYKGFDANLPEENSQAELPFHQAQSINIGSDSKINDITNSYIDIYYQYKNSYILTSVKSGLMLIDQHRAHVCVLFHQFISNIRQNRKISQRLLFPEIIEFSTTEASMIPYLLEDLETIGFELSPLGNNTFSINGTPAEINHKDPVELIHHIVEQSIETGSDIREEIQESIALSLANASAIDSGQKLSQEEMAQLVGQLVACPMQNYTPDGKSVISILKDSDIKKMLK